MDDDVSGHAAPRAAPDSIDALIERWWIEHFPGSPVAQVTQAWNHALAAKQELKRMLRNASSENS
jgi:hypothetical protein